MKLYQRDLRLERLDYTPHLSSSVKGVVVGFYILLGIGLTTLGAYSIGYWKSKEQANVVREDLRGANKQLEMLKSVTVQLEERRELAADIQAWLSQRYDLEAIYHECVGLAHSDLLMQSFAVSYESSRSTLVFSIGVEGDAQSYNTYFRTLTSFFTTAPETKVADIQISPRPDGALLSIEVLAEGESAVTARSLTHSG